MGEFRSMGMSPRAGVLKSVAAAATALVLVAGMALTDATPAAAAGFTFLADRASSGTAAPDPSSACSTQGSPTPADHCAGRDTTVAATDQIVRTYDSADVRFSFNVDGADTGITIRSTIPLGPSGQPIATWSSIPAACSSASTRTDGDRTLNCIVGNLGGATDGAVTARLQVLSAPDGTTFTVPATISSDTNPGVAATSTATFTVSNAPRYNTVKNNGTFFFGLPAPFPYNSPTGEPGYVVPTSTIVFVDGLGGYSALQSPATWNEDIVENPAGMRLMNWGEYGTGCGSYNQASATGNSGYSNVSVFVTHQIFPPSATVTCSQSGGPGTPVTVNWTNPSASPTNAQGGSQANVWTMLWIPTSSLTPNASNPFTLRTSAWDPTDVNGVSNYFGATESTTDNTRPTTVNTADNRTFSKQVISDSAAAAYNPQSPPGSIGTVNRGGTFQSLMQFQNIGGISQTPVQICDVFDNTVLRLADFAAAPSVGTYPSGTYAVAVTKGNAAQPALPLPYQPAAGYNGTTNAAVDPAAYTIEFGVGDLDVVSGVTQAPQSGASMGGEDCADAAPANGWHSDPNDPAILSYAASLGLSDPFDVINRVRVTLNGAPIDPGQWVGVKFRFEARSTYRAATSQSGQTIFATTRLLDTGSYNYPQLPASPGPWPTHSDVGPRITGTLGVQSRVAKSMNVTRVQPGQVGQDTATYTLRSYLLIGENMPTNSDTGNPYAPVRVVDYLPAGMIYLYGSASLEPDHVLAQPDGSTLIVWDLGDQYDHGVQFSWVQLPTTITYQAKADPLAPTPSINHNGAYAEVRAPDGTYYDTNFVCSWAANNANFLHFAVPATASIPIESTTLVPNPALDYGGCAGQGNLGNYHYARLEIGSAVLELAAIKSAIAPQIQPGSADGVGGDAVGWTLSYQNNTSNTLPGVDIIDVIPYNGDGRTPASDFSGSLDLTSITTDDALSAVPNALPASDGSIPPRSGTTFYFTTAASGSIQADPYDSSNRQGGATLWCLQSQFGTPGCPAAITDATAVRAISGSLASGAGQELRLGFATEGNLEGDVYSNEANARAVGLTSLVYVPGDSIQVVASSVSGTIWNDADGDGAITAGESPVGAGVSVRLTGTVDNGESVDVTLVTGADGTYLFADLRAGSYTVTVDQDSLRAIDSSYAITYDPQSGTTAPDGVFPVTVGLSQDVTAQHVGVASQSLSGVVYLDADDDGAQDAGESGHAGATVTLSGTDDLGNPVSVSVLSDASGVYTFPVLRPGTYDLQISPVPGYIGGKVTPGTAGGTAGTPGSGSITGITLLPAQDAMDYRFALLVPRVISGTVYSDTNDNGVRDAGEPGIPNVTINLSGTDENGAVTRAAVTLADGTFAFTDLRDGEYELSENQPAGFYQGTTSANGADGAVSGDTISGITAADGSVTTGYLFGERAAASLSGVVYHDQNANGVQDAGEPGLTGVSVSLTGTASVGPVLTDATGAYTFPNLEPGTYTVAATDAAGYLDARETAGTAGGTVSPTAGSNTISDVVLAPGAAATGYLFGDVQAASLSGVVFIDTDNDGVLDATENGIGSVTVTLTGTDLFGAAVGPIDATTAIDGSYSFAGLLPGSYTVTETTPSGYFDGLDAAGSAGGTVGNDTVSGIVLGSGTAATGYTFGERAASSISGSVFSDIDGDATRDAGEAGHAGISIVLLDGGGNTVATTTTLADGSWQFTGIAPGTYTVRQLSEPVDHVDGAVVVGDAGGTAGTDEVSGIALNGTTASGYHFAEIPLSVISGTVWHDANDNGAIDAGEAPIAGVTVTLSGPESRTTTTDANGGFTFGGLPAGTYTVVETQPSNWADGQTLVGANGGDASVKNTISGIVLDAGSNATGYGFGERAAELQVLVRTQTLDAPTATGPYVTVGDPVLWTYEIRNNGDTAVDSVVLTDDQNGVVSCPETTIPPGGVLVCEVTGVAAEGQQAHTATATANVVPSGPGGPGEPGEVTVLEATSAASYYFGMLVGAVVTATVNGVDAMTSPGPVFPHGTTMEVVVTIENTGNVPLTLDTLATGGLGALDCGSVVTVAPGETLECRVTWNPDAGNYAYAISAVLNGPDATAVDGETSPTELTATASAYFQLLERNVEIAHTGTSLDFSWLGVAVLLPLIGTLLIAWHRRQKEVHIG